MKLYIIIDSDIVFILNLKKIILIKTLNNYKHYIIKYITYFLKRL